MKNNRLIILSVIGLILSFVVAGYLSVNSLHKVIAQNDREKAETVAISIYDDVDDYIRQPIIVTKSMANGPALLQAIKSNDEDYFASYLAYIKDSFGYDTFFFVNDATGNYYTDQGLSANIADSEQVYWYHSLRDSGDEYALNVELDDSVTNKIVLFVNRNIYDPDHKFIGMCGCGVGVDVYEDIIKHYEDAYGVLTYLLNDDGTILVGSSKEISDANLRLALQEAVHGGMLHYADTYDGGCIITKNLDDLHLRLVIVKETAGTSQFAYLLGQLLIAFAIIICLMSFGIHHVRKLSKDYEQQYEISMNKSSFLANMSHELRTPINVILGMTEMLLREGGSGATKGRALDIKSAAQILLSLINDILDFSKIESGQMRIISADYSLVGLITDLALLSESRARQKSLAFKMEIQPDLPLGLHGDDLHLRQICTNLLTNAIKYTSEGTVTLRLSGQRGGDNTITLHLEVEDTGIGIKQEDIGKLFKPYSRVDEYHNRKVEGTGLGLTIIINLLKLMDSRLEVRSVYGQGSVFYFDLVQTIVDEEAVGDIHQRISDAAKAYEYQVSFIAPEAKVLVVDDNAMNRTIFAGLLEKTQIQVTDVSSGQKCLDIVKREHFDLIFMDHLMPDMDGVETLHHLKEQAENLCKDTPVIALTANAFSGDRERYMALGFDDFLSKPIIAERLEALIRQMLPPAYIRTAPIEATSPDQADGDAGEDDALPEIEGVDWDYARMRIGNKTLLLSSLKKFYADIAGEHKLIGELADKIATEEGLTQYRIRVHSLKSTSAQFGIMTLSALAKILEDSARAGETDKISAANPLLLAELLKTKERLAPAMAGEQAKEPLEDYAVLAELLDMLQYHMAKMDIANSYAVADKIKAYAYPPEMQERIDALLEKVSALDFDAAAEEIERIMAEFGLADDEDL